MGIVVLCLAILPALRAGGYQMFLAEVPGPTAERLRPRIKETAAILWGVYVLLSLLETALLWGGGMPLFDAICHTFGTMATGGFSTKDASIGHYALAGHPSALYFEIVIDVFMFLAGCNFLLHDQALHGAFGAYRRDGEFRFYVCVLGGAILLITAGLRLASSGALAALGPGAAVRDAVFQVVSITTTTGYATADFNAWPGAGRVLMVGLMFFGGCAGSTGGGLKQMRILILAKYAYRELLRLLRPRLTNPIRLGDAIVEERTVRAILALVICYVLVFALASFLLLIALGASDPPGGPEHPDGQLVTAVTAVAATLNNIGPGLGAVGATANYGWMPWHAKLLLSICMLLGRLEVFAVAVVLLPLAWRR
jgi:trk system potassium uptake protein TrkH